MAEIGQGMIFTVILLVCVFVGTYAQCRQRCHMQIPQTCPQGFICMEAEKIGIHRCYDVCKDVNVRYVADDTNCARYYDCADNSVQVGLQVPHLRECQPFNLFAITTSTCLSYTQVSCNGRTEPKGQCDYKVYMNQGRIRESCQFVNGTTDCSSCVWPGCTGMNDGWNRIPGLKHLIVNCRNERDLQYTGCPLGLMPADLNPPTSCILDK